MKRILLFIDKRTRLLRIAISLTVAAIIWFILRDSHPPAIVFMASWIGFSGSTLLTIWASILVLHPREIASVAVEEDNTRFLTFAFVISAASISLFAIVLLLQAAPNARGLSHHILLSAISVFCSWTLIHTVFTLKYAHMYYTFPSRKHLEAGEQPHGGLDFPGTEHPDFLDFAYFSFVLGMTFQVADVSITGRSIRRLALLHGFIAFVYNTIIVALSINIVSGMVAK
ncbi:MAG TPA: DUF1345 domain-containing protein [Chitinophagaceae bacterium]|nr:DUF1345 domain-containing protein [Chitinophagaceae bacterium]